MVNAAVPPESAASPRKPLLVALGMLAGILVAVLLAVIGEARHATRQSAETSEQSEATAAEGPAGRVIRPVRR